MIDDFFFFKQPRTKMKCLPHHRMSTSPQDYSRVFSVLFFFTLGYTLPMSEDPTKARIIGDKHFTNPSHIYVSPTQGK